MAREEKSNVPVNSQNTSPEYTQQVVSEEPQQTPSQPSQETPFKVSEEAPARGEWCKAKKLILTFLLCAFVFLTGCGTITTGRYQNITVTSDPPGAKVTSCTGVSLTTPGSIKLARNHNYTLIAEYPGCEPQKKELEHKLQRCFWRNVLICGVISTAVDLASGASYELRPEEVHFDFTSTSQAVASHQRSYLELHSETAEEVRFAILNEPANNVMTKE